MTDRDEILIILNDDEKLTAVTRAVFDVVDKDHSGQIDKAELMEAMVDVAREAHITRPTEDQVNKAMAALDADHSGTISVDEFKELIRQLLKAIAGIESE